MSANTSITKVSVDGSPRGPEGQRYLASGVWLGMRLWEDEAPGEKAEATVRDYETVGYVLSGRAELHIAEQVVILEPGDSWVVNRGQEHAYRILEPFTAVEATHPPSHVHGRDAG